MYYLIIKLQDSCHQILQYCFQESEHGRRPLSFIYRTSRVLSLGCGDSSITDTSALHLLQTRTRNLNIMHNTSYF